MKTNRTCYMALLMVAVGAAASVASAQVQQNPTGTDKDNYYIPAVDQTFKPGLPKAPAPKAAPAAAPAPAKPAPTPPPAAKPAEPAKPAAAAAVAGGGTGRNYRPTVPAGYTSSSLAFPTGDINTSALLVHRLTPTQVRVGQEYMDEIHVTNLTNGNLQNVMVTLSGFDNYSVKSSTPAAMSGGAPGTLTWALGNMNASETKIIKLNGTATKVGATASCVSANFANTLCMGTQVVEPALKITKAMPATTTICDTIPVVITVTNSGTGSADNIKVTDTLPAGLTVDGKNAFESVIGTLAAGQSREVRFSAKAAKAGAYSNAATATADGGLKADSGNVSTTVTAPSLDIKLECPPAQLLIGRNATFKATITNTGDAPCAATASATLPAGATFVSADAGGTSAAGKVNWNLGNLAPKASKVVTFVLNSKTAGSLQTSITGNCTNCPGTAPVANCTTSFQGVPDIGTGVSDSDGVVVVGQNHTFTYSVVNQGQVNLTNVTMVGDLSDGLEFVSATSPTAPQVAGKKLTFTIGTLTPGQKVTFNIVAKGTAAGEQGISTETRSTELKRTVRNDEQVTYVAQ